MALEGLLEEANKIKTALENLYEDIPYQPIPLSEPSTTMFGRYFGTGLTLEDVQGLEARRLRGEKVDHYKIRIDVGETVSAGETQPPGPPNVLYITDGRQTCRLRRVTVRERKLWRTSERVEYELDTPDKRVTFING